MPAFLCLVALLGQLVLLRALALPVLGKVGLLQVGVLLAGPRVGQDVHDGLPAGVGVKVGTVSEGPTEWTDSKKNCALC